MEELLRFNLAELGRRYMAAVKKSSLPAIGKMALNDNTVFGRILSGENGFNIRTYDRLIFWFHFNWPLEAEWPEGIQRPVDIHHTHEAAE